ncbi:enoyl-CoA hydratase/isomerase family protein [Phenylobacterium sp. LjRoot225]|uniref:enoyl-CoA hydratase/isomerase family protein n=1 Tax=Phenylobacterium sp. LjRoot225 TaxID=3342285 RepID=UPI003ECEDBFB
MTVDLAAGRAAPSRPGPGVVHVGVHRGGALPDAALDDFDILLSVEPSAPAPWVGLPPERLEAALQRLRETVEAQPAAAAVAAQILRISLEISFDQALVVESLGYSMLLATDGFRAWRATTPAPARNDQDQSRVAVSREGETLAIRLTRAGAHNAVDARMRDALCEALEFALIDPDQAPVVLSGEGRCFSEGGDLAEFGSFDDPGRAHLVRTLRAPAALVRRLGPRATAKVHGACIGSGIEIPAAAGRVVARRHAWFRLPEVSMGLIPGAGGTASIPRRIGRQRACFMAVSGLDIRVSTALDWGLVDAVENP